MTTLFDSALAVNVAPFGLGLSAPARPARRKPYTAMDVCWQAGFTAGQEDGPAALPPSDLDDNQTSAWIQGRESAVVGGDPSDPAGWDDINLDAEQAEFEDAMACGFFHA